MNPKIFFRYSGIYDLSLYHFSTGDSKDADDPVFKERKRFVLNKIKEIDSWWSSEGDGILNNIADNSGIDWKQTRIKIYLLADAHRDTWMGGFSEPITIFLKKRFKGNISEREFLDVKRIIIHELVHQNISLKDNYEKYIDFVKEKYKCNRICAVHIVVHALLEKIYSSEELKFELSCKHQPDYKCAWEIIKKEGSDNIIEEFKKWA